MERAGFERMEGFHKLKSLWSIEYKATTLEPTLTQAASDEAKELVDSILGKTIPKDLPDAVPLILDGKVVVTGNAVKGIFRHTISAQLREAGVPICFQEVKYSGEHPPERQCPPESPTWFGTPSRQGALYFSFLKSLGKVEDVLAGEPIPMIALRDEFRAQKGRAFLLLAPVREGAEFSGYIKGENLSHEILGALKEIQDMSREGFIRFGGFKTRGFGSVRVEITKVEEYGTTPFKLKETYEGERLKGFLEMCQKKYHELMARGRAS
jgi:hypothetical protein